MNQCNCQLYYLVFKTLNAFLWIILQCYQYLGCIDKPALCGCNAAEMFLTFVFSVQGSGPTESVPERGKEVEACG